MSLLDHCVNAKAMAAILSIAYGRGVVPADRHEQRQFI